MDEDDELRLARMQIGAEVYRQGWQDGVRIALLLMLGQAQPIGVPYRGPPLPPEAVDWIRTALLNVGAHNRSSI